MDTTTDHQPGAALARDVWWNVASLAIAGGFGILLNYLVSVVYGAAALGVFNQVFAVYILFSQLAALGLHYSALKHVAATADADERRVIVTTAVLASAGIGAIFAAALWLMARPVGDLLGSPEVGQGLRWVAPGVLLFGVAKVTLACLNALQRMRWYAVLFGGRFVLMVIAFAGCVAVDADAAALPVVLPLAEAVTLLVSLLLIAPLLRWFPRPRLRRWSREHLRFGLRGFSSGLLSELNTRVDVLILGLFTADAVVGAYSFAAILAEGIYQLLVVLRTNYAPIVIQLLAAGETEPLLATIRRTRDRTYLAALAVGALAVAGYALLVPLATSDPALADSWQYFAVLIAGMVASAGYAVFQPMLLYAGLPGWHTLMMLAIVAVNAAANVALIALLGAIGSALATALAFVVGVALLRGLARGLLRLRI